MSMFVFKIVVLVLVLGSQRLVAVDSCGFPDAQLVAPDDCTVIWKSNEDQPLQTETFDNCTFSKQHIIATLPNGVDWEIWENPNETDSEGNFTATFDLGTATFFSGYDANGKASGAYKAQWKNSGDFISRAGLQFEKADPTQANKMKKGCTYTKYGKMTAEYSFKKIAWDGVKDIAGTYSYVGIYGWARNPLVEFYIIDDWFGRNSPPLNPSSNPVPPITVCNDVAANACKIGEYDMDGGTYELYSKTRGPAYSVNGNNQCFTQIYAVRKTTRQCGTIQIDKHFAEWAKEPFCLVLNEMYEAKILVESGGGEGWIEFTHLTVTKQYECNEGGTFTTGVFPVDSYQCPTDLPTGQQIKYVAKCPGEDTDGDGDGAEKLWSKKTWVGMVVLWVVFFLFW